MERAKVFVFAPIRIPSVIETDRPNRQFVTQPEAERVAHVIQAGMLGSRQKISSVEKGGALKLTINWERVFDIENGVELAANRIALWIVRTKGSFAETPNRG